MNWPTKGERNEIDGDALREAGARVVLRVTFDDETREVELDVSEVEGHPVTALGWLAYTHAESLFQGSALVLVQAD